LVLAACGWLCARSTPLSSPAPQAILERAHELHLRLEQRPVSDRTVGDYTKITDLLATVWRHQPRVDPTKDVHATPAEEALFDAAGIEIALATDLQHAPAWSSAAQDLELLLQRFPSTLYRRNAEWALAQIDWYHRREPLTARRYLRDFLRRYPADPRAPVARRQVRGERVEPPPALWPTTGAAGDSAPAGAPSSAPGAVRFEPIVARPPWELNDQAQAQADAPAPSSAAPVSIEGLRWTTTPDGISIIVDVSGRPDWQRGTVPETHSVYFDLKGDFGRLMDRRSVDLSNPLVQRIVIAQNRDGVIRLVIHENRAGEHDTALWFPNPSRLVVAVHADSDHASDVAQVRAHQPKTNAAAAPLAAGPVPKSNSHSAPSERADAGIGRSNLESSHPAPAHGVIAKANHGKTPAESARDNADSVVEASPLADGNRSLTRALGLKIGRIVLDAGHGGHDTGTIGPNGLAEKNVVLDVTLRLGRLLHRRLGADVIYTRHDDTFIPLRERTAIANRAHADLFVSIHANSSPEKDAEGVETYFLNLTQNARALNVAARENAAGQMGEHELQTLLQSITADDKRQESQALGHDLEVSLSHALHEDNRGVKSAPFIVLIGAHMPSVLAEISFLSNAHDARLLARPSYRQRIAEGLYRGIARYVKSLGGVQADVARRAPPPSMHEVSAAANPAVSPDHN